MCSFEKSGFGSVLPASRKLRPQGIFQDAATLLERVEQLGHYPKRMKKPTTDGERAENSLAMRISQQWSKLDDATKAKFTRLQQSVRADQPAAASSSCSSAEKTSTPPRSVEQPATPHHFQILSIRDVQRWLAVETVASCSSANMERIREAVAVLSRPKPRKEEVQPLQSKWQVAQKKDKKPRPLGDVIQELSDKVINAAVTLQQQLADSAERPAASCVATAEQPSSAVSAGEDPSELTELKMRQQKRAIESAAEEQRPRAKAKAAKGQNKRTAGTTSDSVAQAASKRQQRCLTTDLFAASVRDPSEPGAAS